MALNNHGSVGYIGNKTCMVAIRFREVCLGSSVMLNQEFPKLQFSSIPPKNMAMPRFKLITNSFVGRTQALNSITVPR